MSVEELADNFRGLALEQEYLLFNPPTEHRWLVRTFDEIPRYLFRIQTTRSNGLTDSNWAKSKDAKNRKPDSIMDIFSQPQNSVADMLSRHLWWETEDRPHNFLSWTSSLLFAIQYIFYRFHNDPLSLQDIQIYIVDTTEFPNGVFARDLDLIKIFSPRNENLQSLQKLRNRKPTGHSGLYFGEYLSQGALKIKDKCGFVSAQDFVGPQLFRLRPEFERALETDMGWAKEVVRLREIFYRSAETEGRIGDLQAAIHLGDLFGGCWALPIVISLMALRPCRDEDKVLIVRELLTTHGAREASRYCDTKRIGSHNERLPEVKLFDEIMLKTYVKSTFELLRAHTSQVQETDDRSRV
ncbi:hypothetical protein N7475_008617 [Penicillium sp. IBT 31633x]|nr:hypothetical protein N7475_008617 [Penicillium sp. IBT 31633x]